MVRSFYFSCCRSVLLTDLTRQVCSANPQRLEIISSPTLNVPGLKEYFSR